MAAASDDAEGRRTTNSSPPHLPRDVDAANGILNAFDGHAKGPVAGLVTEGVVDVFEVVEVDQHD